jgi:hypothetical protein
VPKQEKHGNNMLVLLNTFQLAKDQFFGVSIMSTKYGSSKWEIKFLTEMMVRNNFGTTLQFQTRPNSYNLMSDVTDMLWLLTQLVQFIGEPE